MWWWALVILGRSLFKVRSHLWVVFDFTKGLLVLWFFDNFWKTLKMKTSINASLLSQHKWSTNCLESLEQNCKICHHRNHYHHHNHDYDCQTISLEFRSSVIMDASPPTCVIHTNGTFILPPQPRAPGLPHHQAAQTSSGLMSLFLTNSFRNAQKTWLPTNSKLSQS